MSLEIDNKKQHKHFIDIPYNYQEHNQKLSYDQHEHKGKI